MTSVGDIHVLVVDDSRQMRRLTRSILRAAGVNKVFDAESAPDALEVMHRIGIDLVLLDWKMEPMDGLAFARVIRLSESSPNPYVPILMLTAHTEASRVAAARDAGVTGFVKKPLIARVLFERMQNALLDHRVFVRTSDFFGPDRRHSLLPGYGGPFRRADDRPTGRVETVDVDDLRHCA
jgi:CheY-like chemotaxis protein